MKSGGRSRAAQLLDAQKALSIPGRVLFVKGKDGIGDREDRELGHHPGGPFSHEERGAVVVREQGRQVEDGEALQMALGPEAIDRPTPIKLIRGGALHDITLIPGPRPN